MIGKRIAARAENPAEAGALSLDLGRRCTRGRIHRTDDHTRVDPQRSPVRIRPISLPRNLECTMKRFVLAAATTAITALMLAAPASAQPKDQTLHVYKTPWCGCCTAWAEHMSGLGYEVEITELEDLAPVREQSGVPDAVKGCHSAAIAGYAIEGHVPPGAIAKLVEERPDVRGIAVPGMPMGSVGMGSDPNARYDVLSFGADGEVDADPFYQAGR